MRAKKHSPQDTVDGTSLAYGDLRDATLLLAAVRLANGIALTPGMTSVWCNTTDEQHEWAYSMIDKGE